jgi:hypothetical protein
MRGFYLTGSILLTVLILIVAFENIGGACQGFLFLFASLDQGTSPFFIVMGIALLGGITGVFYTGLFMSLLKSGQDEEPGGNEW